MVANHCFELADRLGVTAGRKIGLEPQLERGQAQSFEAGYLAERANA